MSTREFMLVLLVVVFAGNLIIQISRIWRHCRIRRAAPAALLPCPFCGSPVHIAKGDMIFHDRDDAQCPGDCVIASAETWNTRCRRSERVEGE